MDVTAAPDAEERADRQLGFLWLATALALVLLSPLARWLAPVAL